MTRDPPPGGAFRSLTSLEIVQVVAIPISTEPELDRAASRRPLGERAAAEIERDLRDNPDALLSALLRALRTRQVWVEQEALLGT
jgi:hypothetical protein